MNRIPVMSLMIFKKGTHVVYEGMPYVVDHVILSNAELLVVLDTGIKVKAESVTCKPTAMDFNRGLKES
jgi:hypothetical protein